MGEKMKSIISVIVPVYNEEVRISRCIESILNQDIQELELILIDDGSTDSSGRICEKYARKDSRIQVIHQKNSGVGSARNTGITASKGKYIAFVDSDDYLPNNSGIYSKAISILEYNQVEVVAWLWQFQDENGNLVIDSEKIPSFFLERNLHENLQRDFITAATQMDWLLAFGTNCFEKNILKIFHLKDGYMKMTNG